MSLSSDACDTSARRPGQFLAIISLAAIALYFCAKQMSGQGISEDIHITPSTVLSFSIIMQNVELMAGTIGWHARNPVLEHHKTVLIVGGIGIIVGTLLFKSGTSLTPQYFGGLLLVLGCSNLFVFAMSIILPRHGMSRPFVTRRRSDRSDLYSLFSLPECWPFGSRSGSAKSWHFGLSQSPGTRWKSLWRVWWPHFRIARSLVRTRAPKSWINRVYHSGNHRDAEQRDNMPKQSPYGPVPEHQSPRRTLPSYCRTTMFFQTLLGVGTHLCRLRFERKGDAIDKIGRHKLPKCSSPCLQIPN